MGYGSGSVKLMTLSIIQTWARRKASKAARHALVLQHPKAAQCVACITHSLCEACEDLTLSGTCPTVLEPPVPNQV